MFTAVLIIAVIELVLLMVILFKVFSRKYDGSMIVDETDTKKTFSLEIDVDPDDLDKQKELVLKIRRAMDEK